MSIGRAEASSSGLKRFYGLSMSAWMVDAQPEPPQLELRCRMVRTGCWLTLVVAVACAVWVAATWSSPNRSLLAALAVITAISAALVAWLPTDRILAGRHGDLFLLTWSALDIGVVVLAGWADGGIGSPIVSMLFLALIYAALSYPRWMVVVVSALSMLAVVLLAVIAGLGSGGASPAVHLGGLLVALAIAGVLCAAQANIQAEQRAALSDLSARDPLTDTLNRRGFALRLSRELARHEAQGDEMALLYLDLDRFKAVNDQHGHGAGDEMLAWVAVTVGAALRPADALGRMGGDEFVVALPGADAQAADLVARRISSSVAERIGVSVGIALASEVAYEPQRLHRAADADLYLSKRRRSRPRLAGLPAGASVPV